MGSSRQYDGVRAASASTIEIDFYYAGKRFRERLNLQPTPANLRRASQHRAAVLIAIDQGTFDYAVTFPNSKNARIFAKKKGDTITLASFLDDWLERKTTQLAASTWDDYRKTINAHLVPKLGRLMLTEVTRQKIRLFAAELKCSNKRIANILSVLRSALSEAAEDELIDSNPIVDWKYRNKEAPKEDDDIDPFSSEEQHLILQQLPAQSKNFIQFAFWTGMRTSELVALNWKDVDWIGKYVKVRRATTQAATRRAKARQSVQSDQKDNDPQKVNEQVAESTKTVSGRRDIKLLGPAWQALIDQKAFTYVAGNEVFQNPRTLERWTGDQAIRKTMWMPALKRAKVRYRNPYQTRHTYASMMLSAGEHPMWVAKQMGHKDWGMIRKVYGRLMGEAQPDAGSKAEDVFGQHLVSISARLKPGAG